jgi:radical SAM protein with 4Fe4S-binding SPASM domain
MDSTHRTEARPLLHVVMSKAADRLVPLQAALELTYRCNLHCKHCYIDLPSDDELSFTEWRDAISQLKAAGCLYLLLTGGEPLVRPDSLQIARYARGLGFIPMILTNGTLITPEVAKEIASLRPLFVGLSIYGATDETHDAITGRSGSLQATLHGIGLLRQHGVVVKLQTVLMDSNAHEAAEMRRLACDVGVSLDLKYDLSPTKCGALSPQCHQLGQEQLATYADAEWVVPAEIGSADHSGICMAGRASCSISPNGNVYPCIMMPLEIGNLRQAKFSEIWSGSSGSRLAYLRGLEDKDLSECSQCELTKYCSKCMGRNLTETGELTKPAPSACRNAAVRCQVLAPRREVRHEETIREAEDDIGEGRATEPGSLRQLGWR